ncbi:WD40 repeat-like protein [Rhizoclosmatium globosum]|uniref:WD40 repeat-like protein n=1 Tax=Rhizoclosmatium globosum TaxID=329046 RepID=A0A1Y2BQT6_9FUNG|nr:WD40 repeat-like protein [Rhizoclosmatium globosum]|eukprot:ORY36987.1 WD40 repeat-like protein [Rhizoclosmatium globosum]
MVWFLVMDFLFPKDKLRVQPFSEPLKRFKIQVNKAEITVSDLKQKIKDIQKYPDDQPLKLYFTIENRKGFSHVMLTQDVILSNVFELVQDCEKELLFDFAESYIVTISPKTKTNQDPVTVELKSLEIDELEKNVMLHFYVATEIKFYRCDLMSNQVLPITTSSSLKKTLTSYSCDLVFETPGQRSLQLQTSSQLPQEDTLTMSASSDFKSKEVFDVFISYCWADMNIVELFYAELKTSFPQLKVWKDNKGGMTSDVYTAMPQGISTSKIVMAFFSEAYFKSENCNREIKYAADLKKNIMPVHLSNDNVPNLVALRDEFPAPFFITAGKLYHELKGTDATTDQWKNLIHNTYKEVCGKGSLSSVDPTLAPLYLWLRPVDFSKDYASFEEEYVPGTRLQVIDSLNAWRVTDERAMFMHGAAGTGKSLVVYSLRVNLPKEQYVLGAMFICKHNDARKSDPLVLISSIVYELCQTLGGEFKRHVEAEKALDDQRVKENKQSILKVPIVAFETLVVDGLMKLTSNNKTVLIIIDALDELKRKERHSILTILSDTCKKLPPWVKVFTTGRPEKDIFQALQLMSPFMLDISDKSNLEDLEKVINTKLSNYWKTILPNSIESKCCSELQKKSAGLFIFACNMCKHIINKKLDPDSALKAIQGLEPGTDAVYKTILEYQFHDRDFNMEVSEKLRVFKRVFSVLLGLKKPLSIVHLANVGNLIYSEVESVVSDCRSILKFENGIISVLHKSVKDFFYDKSRSGTEFQIVAIDSQLAVQCLKILATNLTRNMSGLDSTKFYNKENLAQLPALNDDILYALEFWIQHYLTGFQTASSAIQEVMIQSLHNFVTSVLPFYLEALLLISNLSYVFPAIEIIKYLFSKFEQQTDDMKIILSLLNDLKFIGFNFRNQLLASPLQVYNHALIGVPQETKYFEQYSHLVTARITIGAEKNWGPLTLTGHSSMVRSVAFSPDSRTVVSGSEDQTVKLWSVETGECVKTLAGHSLSVRSVAFSPDSRTVVSGSEDQTVKVWSVETGECVKTLAGHSLSVRSVAFSPNSRTVVSGSEDQTVKVWSVETGECVKTLAGHSLSVRSVAFSPNSRTVVSGSEDQTVKLWSVETGECVKTLAGHSDAVNSVAFHPDSTTVVSGSGDHTVKLWSVETGECIKTLAGHSDSVNSVALSLRTVVSGSNDQTIKLWSFETRNCVKVQNLAGHDGIVFSVAFPDYSPRLSFLDLLTNKLDCGLQKQGNMSRILLGIMGKCVQWHSHLTQRQ